MGKTQIMVNGVFLETSNVIAHTLQVNNFGDITTRQGGFSNQFEVPITAQNSLALGFSNNMNESDRFPYQKLPAQLYDTNTLLYYGYLKITEISGKKFVCTFFSDNSDFFNLIKDKTIRDLDLSDLDHTWNTTTIRTSFTNTSGYIYPLIDYGRFPAKDFADALTADYFYPAVYVSTLLDKIFEEAGFNYEGEFLDSYDYDHLIIPFSGKDFVRSRDEIDNSIQTLIPDDAQLMGTNDLVNFQGGNITTLTITAPGDYNIFFQIRTVPVGTLGLFAFRVRKNGVDTSIFVANNEGGLSEKVVQCQGVLSLVAGDVLSVLCSATPIAGFVETIEQDSFFTISLADNMVVGAQVEMGPNLPDITQSDFLKYLANAFGLIITSDPVLKTVRLNYFRSLANNKANALDWSDKIDIKTEKTISFTELVGDYANKSIFNYLEDADDDLLVTYESVNGERFGSGTLEIDNEHISNKKEIYEAPFSGMINRLSFDNKIYIPQIKWQDSSGNKEFTPVPKIAYIETGLSVRELTGGEFGSLNFSGTSDPTSIPFCWFSKAPYTINTDLLTQSLSFGDVIFTSVVEGLLLEYWSEYANVLSNVKYLSADFKLSGVDIAQFDFTKPVYIDYYKAYFFVNSINEFTGSDQLTEVELVKLP
jgi:hypothetical protein